MRTASTGVSRRRGTFAGPFEREIAIERLADRLDVAASDHRLRHVRAAGRALLHEGEDLVGLDRHAELREPLGDPVHALPPLFALRAQELLKPRRVPVDAVAEHVDLGARDVAVDLEAGDDLERRQAARLVHGLADAAGGIVVGDGEDADAMAGGQPHELARRQGSVGRGRVRVQVDRGRHG